MSGITFTSKIKNEAALYKNLDDVKQAIKSANINSLKRVAEETKEKAKSNIIELGLVDTGALLDSIKVSEKGLEKEDPTVAVYADYVDSSIVNSKRKTPLKKNTYYAFALEYSSRGRPATPYLHPAYNDLYPKLPDYYVEELQKEIK